MCVMYVVCGIVLVVQSTPQPAVFYTLYGLSFFFCNMGPNTTTFVIPSELFPTSIRASAHGISAAAGKMGAAIGTALMPAILDASESLPAVMFTSAAVAAVGFLFTVALTRESQHTDIMQTTQQLATAGGDNPSGSNGSTDSDLPQPHSGISHNSLPSLSLSRAIRKARGYTDLLKQQSTIDEEEDEPAHIDMEDVDMDEHDELDEEHHMDESDDEERDSVEHQEQLQKAEATAPPTIHSGGHRSHPNARTAENSITASQLVTEVELTSAV